MLKASLTALLVVLTLVVAPAHAQQAPTAALTPDEARQALDVLKDDAKRTQFINTLEAIAKAAPQAPPATPAQPPSNTNLVMQLLVQVSDWLGNVSSELASAGRTVSDFPMVWRWTVQTATDPAARHTLIDAAWKLALLIALALAAEWGAMRAVRVPRAAVERYLPQRARTRAGADSTGTSAVHGPHGLRQQSLTYAWQLMLRLPFVLGRLALDLVPVVAFAAVGNVLLASQIGGEATSRVVILAVVNAYVLYRGIVCVTAALVSPAGDQPSLLVIRDETAAYVDIWVKRIVIVAVFGVALANVALILGLYRPAYEALVKLVMLVAHLFVVIIILQCRRAVADLIRSGETEHGTVALMRNRLADIWHVVAVVLDLALWAVWALQVRNGYALLLQYFIATVAVLVIARLALVAIMAAFDRLFRISPDFIRQFPGLEARANRYFPVLRGLVSGLIAVITVIALLEVWGIDAAAWFASGQIGGRLVSAFATIGIAAAVALGIWEASNAGIERQLTRLSHEGQYARAARLRTFLPMLRTTLFSAILTVVVLTALSQLGINIAPLLAGAGIIGIAIGFGSQKLVQDVITGLFLLLENAMQVGDTVTVSGLSGVVENLSIRTIRLRAGDGSVHIIPFSSVTSVTNTNRGIGNAAVSVNVAFKEDTDRVGQVLKEIAGGMRSDPQFKPLILGDLELWGVDKVDASMATIVGQIRCTDAGRWPVQREFYRRLKRRFQELGIEIARPSQTTVVLQGMPVQQLASPDRDEAEQPERKRKAAG